MGVIYRIDHDRLQIDGQPVPYTPSNHQGGRITPTLIVLHDTSGRLERGNSAGYLVDNPSQVSAHVVVERDGSITQLVPFDRRANHAGQSTWGGRQWCNGFAIGIEIVNPGKMLVRGDDVVAWYGQTFNAGLYECSRAATPLHGDGWWMAYTKQQLAAVQALVEALALAYPSIAEVVGHHDISPGRKVDPTPLMPWDRMREALASGIAQRAAPVLAHGNVDVAGVQEKLAGLGYYGGVVDGRIGTKTEAATFAFQRENGLELSGRVDEHLVAALATDDAKAMPTGHREEVTARDLAEMGSSTIPQAWADRREGGVQAIIAAVTAILVALRQLVQEAGVEVVIVLACLAAAYFGIRQMQRGGWMLTRRVAEHKEGVR